MRELQISHPRAVVLTWWEATRKFPKKTNAPKIEMEKFPLKRVKKPPKRVKKPTMKEPTVDNAIFENTDTSDPDVKQDVMWVYQHMHNKGAKPPTPGAVSLLKWARESPDAFFRMIGQKVLLPEKPQQDEDEYKPSKEEKMHISRAEDTLQSILRTALSGTGGFQVTCQHCGAKFTPTISDISDG